MFSQNLSINDFAAASKTFNLIYQDGNETRRSDISVTDPMVPRTMVVRHSSSTRDGATVDRHNIVFSKTMLDANEQLRTASVSVVIAVPRDSVFTQSVIDDLVAFAKNFLTQANTTSLLRGES